MKNDVQKSFFDYKETENVALQLLKLNLISERMQYYYRMKNHIRYWKTKPNENLSLCNAQIKRAIDVYKSKIRDIDFQLRKIGCDYAHATRPFNITEIQQIEMWKQKKNIRSDNND